MALEQDLLKKLESRIADVEFALSQPRGQLKYPPDVETQKTAEFASDKFLSDQLFNKIWDDYLYWHTWYESIDGYGTAGTGSATISTDGIAVAATNPNTFSISKVPQFQSVLTWQKEQRFRTNIRANSVSDIVASTVIGTAGSSDHYGFRINDTALNGICGNTAQSVVFLMRIAADTTYTLEARLLPNEKVVFYVDGVARGSLSENLPYAGITGTHSPFVELSITAVAGSKTFYSTYFEFIQKRAALV